MSSCTSGFTILARIATHVVNNGYDIIGARTVWGIIGKNKTYIPICSPRLFLVARVLNHLPMAMWHLKARSSIMIAHTLCCPFFCNVFFTDDDRKRMVGQRFCHRADNPG